MSGEARPAEQRGRGTQEREPAENLCKAVLPAPAECGTSFLEFLGPRRLHFFRTGAVLRMTVDGRHTGLKVGIFRAFPLSQPHRYLSVRDEGGREIGMIDDPAELPAEERDLIEADLERRYLVISIRRVLRLEEHCGTIDWQVDTDRGARRFSTPDLRDNVLCPGPGRYLLTDVEGNRYEIANLADLDSVSRARVLRHL